MHKFIKSTLLVCLLLSCVSFAQDDDAIFTVYTIEFEDFPGETECVASRAEGCFYAYLDCHTTTADEIFEGLSDVPSLDADAFICSRYQHRVRGGMHMTRTALRLHQDGQVADIGMLYEEELTSYSPTEPFYSSRSYTNQSVLSFENLSGRDYFFTRRATEWSISYRSTDGNPEEIIGIRRDNKKFLHILSISEDGFVQIATIPLANYFNQEGSLDEPLSRSMVESYEEWLETLETFLDQLTYTIDWPNTLTIAVNPDAEPTEEQLEWVGVHDLSPLTSGIEQDGR